MTRTIAGMARRPPCRPVVVAAAALGAATLMAAAGLSGSRSSEALASERPLQIAQAHCFDTQGASGLDLVVVEFWRDGAQAGTFRLMEARIGSGQWTEEGPGYPGPVLFHYEEIARDACVVQLHDRARDVTIDLDFGTKTVLSRGGGSSEPVVLGEIDRTFGEKGVWARGGGTKYGN